MTRVGPVFVTVAPAEEGTRIGLVMSKRLVELMGGSVGVESSVGAGSVFWFELGSAAAPELAAEIVEPTAAAREQGNADTPLRTLLYVEDNPANLKLVEELIARRPGMRWLSAVNGNLGVKLARDEQPEVILMDIMLPGITDALNVALEFAERNPTPRKLAEPAT